MCHTPRTELPYAAASLSILSISPAFQAEMMIKGHKLYSQFSPCLWHLLPYGFTGLLCNAYSHVLGVSQPTFLNHWKFINTKISNDFPNLTESHFSRKAAWKSLYTSDPAAGDQLFRFGCSRQQKRHAAAPPPAGVRRRMERNRQKPVGRDKGSLTEQ